MHIINNGSNNELFTVDGLPYRKGLYEIYYNQEADSSIVTIGIRNIYNQQPLISVIQATGYEVNGEFFSANDIVGLVDSLSVTLGFNSGGGGETGDFYFNDGFII